ncbi:hypothetical protein QCM80_13685 [Bradyrhizobium sp. SSUT112]|nr:hypothetical protein [Bradyrhizobium sp. SSUT112]
MSVSVVALAVVFPAPLRPTEVRAHQNQISWFGEEVLNAHAEIGDDGVKIGQVEHKACEDLRSGKLSRGNAAHHKICRWIECEKSTAMKTLMFVVGP